MKNNLKEKIKEFPKSPGVYQFIGSDGDILYVGKAKNLNSRIKSYFLKEIGRGPVIEIMMGLAADIKYLITDSEIEAVLLEAELIKKLKPKYNSRAKDDKSFLVIKITKKNPKSHPTGDQPKADKFTVNDFPCVELVRMANVDLSDKSAEYFGPYPAGLLLKKSLNYLRKVFPFRDCSKTKFSTYQKKCRPCIYGDIRVCTSPCANWIGKTEYQKNINYLKSFLRGKKGDIYKKLNSEMAKLSKAKRFEEAGLVRDRLHALDHLKDVAIGLRDDVFESGKVLFKRIECYDISNIGADFAVGSMVVFVDGKKSTEEYRRFKIKNNSVQNSFPVIPIPFDKLKVNSVEGSIRKISPTPLIAGSRNDKNVQNDLLNMKQILERRFGNNWPKPDLIIIDGGETHLRVARRVLNSINLEIPLISIAKGVKRKKNEFHFGDEKIAKYFHRNLSIQNIAISARDEAHRFAISYYRKLHGKELFK